MYFIWQFHNKYGKTTVFCTLEIQHMCTIVLFNSGEKYIFNNVILDKHGFKFVALKCPFWKCELLHIHSVAQGSLDWKAASMNTIFSSVSIFWQLFDKAFIRHLSLNVPFSTSLCLSARSINTYTNNSQTEDSTYWNTICKNLLISYF